MNRSFAAAFDRLKVLVFYVFAVILFLRADFLRTPEDFPLKISLTSVKNLIFVFLFLSLPSLIVLVKKKMVQRPFLFFSLATAYVLILVSRCISSFNMAGRFSTPFMAVTAYFLFFWAMQSEEWNHLWAGTKRIFLICYALVTLSDLAFHYAAGIFLIVEDYPFWPGKNILGLFLAAGLFIVLQECLNSKEKLKKYVLAAVFLLSFINIIATHSRAAFLGLVAGLSLFFFLRRFRYRALIIGVSLIILLGSLSASSIRDRLMDAFRVKDYTAQERVAIWKGAVQMIKERPWIGVGAGNFSRAFFERKIDFHFDRSQEKVGNYHSHNLFLQIAAESGIPAAVMLLAFFLWLMGKAVALSVRGLDVDAGLISGLAAFFVYSLFDSTYNAYFTHASMFHVNLVVLMFVSRMLWEVDSAARER